MNRRREQSGSERVFRALLWLYPPSLRRTYGDDMAQLFRDTMRDEITHAGPPGALRAWVGALADLAASLPREWPRELRRIAPLPHLSSIHIAFTRSRPHTVSRLWPLQRNEARHEQRKVREVY